MISEELLLSLSGIDPETTIEELIGIIDRHLCRGDPSDDDDEQPTYIQWENLADAAFLAAYHNKPKAFKRLVELISRVLGEFESSADNCLGYFHFEYLDEVRRATCLTCSDAPEDLQVIAYMLGHLKGVLRAYRAHLNRLDPDTAQKIRKRIEQWIPQPVRT
jgi:hypothetical protein